MNFFGGKVNRSNGAYVFEHPMFRVTLPRELIERCRGSMEGTGVTLGVRPQHITILEKKKEGALKGEIYAIERLGKETVVIVQYEGQTKYKALVSPPFTHKMGDVIFSEPQIQHVYLFDSTSGETLLEKKRA
jgi:ABC-type sugar transport system ATPase subunit